jgi:hypothetical protein
MLLVAIACSASAAGPAAATTTAPAPLLLCGADEVFAIDVASAEHGTIEKLWSWRAKEHAELPQRVRDGFRSTDDCKPIRGGTQILISSSSGGCALVERATGRVLWYAWVHNAHSLELLPGNRVVVASSVGEGGDRLVLFDLGRPDQPLADTPLTSAHGVVWDAGRQMLWALGMEELRAYGLKDWDGESRALELKASHKLPDDGGGHDLQAVPGTGDLSVSTERHVYLFDRDRPAFRPHAELGDRANVKSVSVQAAGGRAAWTQGSDEHWWSDAVYLLAPAGEVKLPGERLYKARWLTDGPTPNPRLAEIPVNSWKRVAGFPPVDKGILAYSGGTFDVAHGQFLLFGGGHADYWGNEVWAFDTATLKWRRMYEPDARERYTNDNIDNRRGKLKDSARPYTRHTYNQLCYATASASMFIFGGCGPGWGEIRPTCPTPPDCWSYSFEDNAWTLLHAGPGTPSGFARACCYDAKRNVVWAYAGDSVLHGFDLPKRAWSRHALKTDIASLGTYNYQMAYLPKSDRVLLIGGGETCTIDPETFAATRHALSDCGGKAGLAYLWRQDVALYVSLPGEGLGYRMAAFDCAAGRWHEWSAENKVAGEGCVWDRLQYDPVNDVALLVGYDGVWAYKPPERFELQR